MQLWSGVPIITCAGEHTVSRLCASLLHGIGLGDLITDRFDDYVTLAIDLATHLKTQRPEGEARAAPRNASLSTPARLVRNLERAYLEMWRIHESGEPPRSFNVEEPGSFAASGEIR